MRHGRGKLTRPNEYSGDCEAFYDGDWLQDKKSGQGHELFLNGDEYTGSYLDDKKHGIGRMKFHAGGYY